MVLASQLTGPAGRTATKPRPAAGCSAPKSIAARHLPKGPGRAEKGAELPALRRQEICRDGSPKPLAVRVGFEPTLEFPLNTLSKRAPSTTRPSLQFGKLRRTHFKRRNLRISRSG